MQVRLPVSFSDHQQITLHVSSKGPPERHRGQPRPVIYPIQTSTPTQVHGDLVDELIRMEVGRNVDSRSWDTTVQKCGTSIKRIRKRDNQRLCRMRRRFRIQACTHLLSQRAILQTIQDDLRTVQTIRHGLRLERTMESLRWQFKRASNWEKDQTITTTRLLQIQGIDGSLHKRWSMWFNSIIRAEPYQLLLIFL